MMNIYNSAFYHHIQNYNYTCYLSSTIPHFQVEDSGKTKENLYEKQNRVTRSNRANSETQKLSNQTPKITTLITAITIKFNYTNIQIDRQIKIKQQITKNKTNPTK